MTAFVGVINNRVMAGLCALGVQCFEAGDMRRHGAHCRLMAAGYHAIVRELASRLRIQNDRQAGFGVPEVMQPTIRVSFAPFEPCLDVTLASVDVDRGAHSGHAPICSPVFQRSIEQRETFAGDDVRGDEVQR